MYNKIEYINWRKEATKYTLTNDKMITLLRVVQATRKKSETKTKRSDFTKDTYGLEKHGDYYELYLFDDGRYKIYSSNGLDNNKNEKKNIRADRLFESKFYELNGTTLRKAFGFVEKEFKRCIPKQFYYINEKYIDKLVLASSIDASSQYPSGLLSTLPDAHTAIAVKGRVQPTEEYPFAFYNNGHIAIYNELDTHEWFANRFFPYLFRLDKNDEYSYTKVEEENTLLMKASEYSMTDTWKYFYNIKKSFAKESNEYEIAKLVMNSTIGSWHRKDKDKKRCMTYEDHGSYQLAHLVAVAIARGNQKILNKVDEIGFENILHICVDGIIYMGGAKYGIEESQFGIFTQEFVGACFKMKGINVYAATDSLGYGAQTIKFKHGGYDLIDGKEIDDTKEYKMEDLEKLSMKERIGDIING